MNAYLKENPKPTYLNFRGGLFSAVSPFLVKTAFFFAAPNNSKGNCPWVKIWGPSGLRIGILWYGRRNTARREKLVGITKEELNPKISDPGSKRNALIARCDSWPDTKASGKSSVDHRSDIDERMPVLSQESVNRRPNLYVDRGYLSIDLSPLSKPTSPTIKSHADGIASAVIVEINDIFSRY